MNGNGNGTKPPTIKAYKREGIELTKLSGLKDDDIVIAKIKGAVTQEGANMIIDSLKSTFPKNRILIVTDGADISTITVGTLNKLGWFKKEKPKIIKV